jgi:pyridoxine 5-phosphate synthase
MTRLSVNLNKVALLRNQRDVGYPSLRETAKAVIEAGAHGITVHPRPDARHIRRSDIPELAALIADVNSPFPSFMLAEEQKGDIEFNIEGYPDEAFLKLVTEHACDQVTLVPDAPDQKTSDHGWDIAAHKDFLKDVIAKLRSAKRRVSLFIDPDPASAIAAAEIGADRVELYTGPYAQDPAHLPAYIRTAEAARKSALGINAGHDLTLSNLARFIAAIPDCAEVSIGHAITADALMMGWRGAVAGYLAAIQYGQKSADPHPHRFYQAAVHRTFRGVRKRDRARSDRAERHTCVARPAYCRRHSGAELSDPRPDEKITRGFCRG